MSLSMDPNHVYRDGPFTNPHQPEKWEVRRLLTEHMQAILALIANSTGLTLPNLLIRYSVTSGVNAIRATPNLPVPGPGLALFSMSIPRANTGAVSLNGKSLRTNGGAEIAAGEIQPDDILLFLDNGDHFRLLMDTGSLRNKVAAEAAQVIAIASATRSEAARDIAEGFASDIVSQGNVPIYGTLAGVASLTIPVGIGALRTNGRNSIGDGEHGLYARSTSQPPGTDGIQSADGSWWRRVPDNLDLMTLPQVIIQ